MKNRYSRDMGLTMILVSGIFFCNPVIGFTDILPDAIGFLLLLCGLYRMADMDHHLTLAQSRFRILFGASLGLLAGSYLLDHFMKGIEGQMNPYESPTTRLLLSFVRFVLYVAVLTPAFRQFYMGMDRLCERFGHTEPSAKKRQQKTRSRRMASLTSVFFTANCLLDLLPELTILTSYEYDARADLVLFGWIKKLQFNFDWYDYVTLFRILGCLISLLFSLIFLVKFIGYCKALKGDKPWIASMAAHYEREVLTQTEMLSIRRFSFSFILLYVAILFTLNIKVDYLSVLPGAGFAFLTLVGLLLLGDLIPRQKECYGACIGLGVISVAQIIANRLYLEKYLPGDALFYEGAIWLYLLQCALEVLESVATVVLVYYLLRALYEITVRYTGVSYGVNGEGERLSNRATQKLHLHFSRRMKWVLAIFIAAAAGNVAMTLLSLYVGWFWLLPFVLTIAGIFLYYTLQGELMEEIKNRFSEE